MTELKPCPFCGGEAQIRYTGNGSGHMGYTSNVVLNSRPGFVLCLKCNVSTKRYQQAIRAINRWNERVNDG